MIYSLGEAKKFKVKPITNYFLEFGLPGFGDIAIGRLDVLRSRMTLYINNQEIADFGCETLRSK